MTNISDSSTNEPVLNHFQGHYDAPNFTTINVIDTILAEYLFFRNFLLLYTSTQDSNFLRVFILPFCNHLLPFSKQMQ